MPAVLVHGVPDTPATWARVLAALGRTDTVTLALPGFANVAPEGWSATKEEYAAWVEEQLAGFDEPVDLVGHDWGALLAQRVASVRPDLVRTLACGGGPLDRAYEWHPTARAWQTPGVGEQVMEGMLALAPEDLAAGLAAAGSPPDLAVLQATHIDARMAEVILALYRSAVTVSDEWQDALDAMPHRPAVVFHGADDPFLTTATAEGMARRLDAELVVYPDCGHWWPWERAERTAATLERLWA